MSKFPTIEHAGLLEDLAQTPQHLLPAEGVGTAQQHYSCCFCGVGDSGPLNLSQNEPQTSPLPIGAGRFRTPLGEVSATVTEDSQIQLKTPTQVCGPGGLLTGTLISNGGERSVTAREIGRSRDGDNLVQLFAPYTNRAVVTKTGFGKFAPTQGCVKLKGSLMRQKTPYPIHLAPSVPDKDGKRRSISYDEAIGRLCELVLSHRAPNARTLIYACGQIDYFTIFAMQEVFRLLGVRNLTGNAEHCLNAGAVHNELLTGQEGPFLTLDQALNGPDRFYLLNGWNGFISHPPAFHTMSRRKDLDAYLVEVMMTESALALAKKLGPERILLIRPRTDAHLALAVAHLILKQAPGAIEQRFLESYSDRDSFEAFARTASQDRFATTEVARRIAPEPDLVERLENGIRAIAKRLCHPDTIPINLPSVGLSQTSGVVAHCLWGSTMAMLGKYGLRKDGTPAGGTLRIPGQINAESEVQGLSRKYYMGRIPIDQTQEAASRMGLPPDAYDRVVEDTPRAALDYSEPTPNVPELFICFGTQFESNMMGRTRWMEKLNNPQTKLVVVDPIPDAYSVGRADLIIPSPPHPATSKLYQNGEWKLSLSVPHKRQADETRSDTTIIYDMMARIGQRLTEEPELAKKHPDLARHAESGYMRNRFSAPRLMRNEGEVNRAQLYDRILEFQSGGRGPLFCRFEHDDGSLIQWRELLEKGHVVYGGCGTTRYRLDYEDESHVPFRDIFKNPGRFKFFNPTQADLAFPDGIILNSGRSPLSTDKDRIKFAVATFNSGKSTPVAGMPDENPLYISPTLAQKLGLRSGDRAKVTNHSGGDSIVLPVEVTDRMKGNTTYSSFHKCKAEMEEGRYINTVTRHEGRCPYTGQTTVKATQVVIEKVAVATNAANAAVDTALIDPVANLPIWEGQKSPLFVTDIVHETADVMTFRLQGRPLCRFVYWPGQFGTIVLNLNGKRTARSYTISSSPSRPYLLEFTVKRVPGGLVSNWLLDNLRVGDQLDIAGPKGKFCLIPGQVPHRMLFISAGSGITPVMSMTRWLCDVSANVDIRFLYSAKSQADVVYLKELQFLNNRYRWFTPMVTLTRPTNGWKGPRGRIDASLIERFSPDFQARQIFMCGPGGFMEAVKDHLKNLRFNMANLHLESFGGVRTSVASKLAPASGGAVLLPPAAGVGESGHLSVDFAGTVGKTDGSVPLLDLAESLDVDIPYACRSGTCGECKARLVKGEVDQHEDDGLTDEEKAAGFVLTCVSHAKTDCVLEI
jgi:ferredoxin-NADP reductase/anaerobic selenocysteine-containing dehydrogenase/ferredoxin